jgi:photosystem II stability/assembly factor-like uncharacterized protein
MAAKKSRGVKRGDVLVLLGTMKGAFLMRSGPGRRTWDRIGPFFPGHAVYAIAYDERGGRQRLLAGPESSHWGAMLTHSDDFGASWSKPERAPVRFPKGTDDSLRRIWQIVPGRADEPDVLYCGVEPAALFESKDAGETWSLVRGLWDHPHRPRWQPGGGGLCLHTILPDATERKRIFVAISTAGVYRSDDGGANWKTAHRGVRAQFLPNPHPEFGQCVHKIAGHPSRPGRLYLQNHWGLYRTDDAGESWRDIAKGVPSDFGFCLAVHPHEPETVYVIPLQSDEFRCTPEAKLRVYRTRDGGRSWRALTKGLPQKDALETVLRDALATDTLKPAGVYFGTRSGKLYGSANSGTSWRLLADGLPPIVCVKPAVVGAAHA